MRRAIQSGLADPVSSPSVLQVQEVQAVHGFKPLTLPGQHIVTADMVRAIRDELGD
jgi:hypothetical protein